MSSYIFKKRFPLFLLSGVAAGFCNALIGAGGGILLSLVMGSVAGGIFSDRRQLLATTQAAMIPCCLLSALIYSTGGGFNMSGFAVFAIPAVLGGALGSLLLDKLRPGWVGTIFSILIIFSGIRMIVR